jgi:hypothetical protein
LEKHPFKDNQSKLHFSLANSPIIIGNIIQYCKSNTNQGKTISANFYVSEIVNLTSKNATEYVKSECKKDRNIIQVVKGKAPNKFYIKYIYTISS